MGIVVCYMFYKNALLVLPQWLFAFTCLASGQNFYLEYPLYQFYNIVYTGLPIVLFGVMDQDLPSAVAESLPRLYKEGPAGRFFNRNMFVQWQIEALVAAIAVMVIPLLILETAGVPSADGKTHDIWYMGTSINFAVCCVANLRLMVETKYWTKLTFFLFFLCFPFGWFFTLSWFTKNSTLSFSTASGGSFGNYEFYADATFWLASFLGIFAAMTMPLAITGFVNERNPSSAQRVSESRKMGKLGDLGKPTPGSFIAPAPGKRDIETGTNRK
jgi:magnesium-transporting ATPase (P-type)